VYTAPVFAVVGLATADGVLHRHIKKRGWQLHRGFLLVIGAYVIQDILLLTYSVGARSNLGTIDDVCKAFIFFADLADSLFIVRLSPVPHCDLHFYAYS